MKRPILELVGITKSFNEDFILNNINLSLFPGEVHFLIGKNSSGKSTMMDIISGLIKADSGDILINNHKVSINSIANSVSHGILYIMQDSNC